MNVYPYKQINSGKYTKWTISLTIKGAVVVEYYFKSKRKKQIVFLTKEEIKKSDLPKLIKEAALWAKHDSPSMGLG